MTAAKTNKGSERRGFLLTLGWFLLGTQNMIFFQHRVRMVEQTERVCVPYTFLDTDSKKGLLFNISTFRNFLDILNKGTSPKKHKKTERGSSARHHQQVLMRLRSARGGAERCACQWLRAPCDEVVKQCGVPWTWSLLYVPMKWRAFHQPAHPKAKCAWRGRVSPHAQRMEVEVQFGWKCPEKDAESSALPASETAVGQKSDLPSSASGEDHALHAGFGASVHHTGKRRQQRESRRQ